MYAHAAEARKIMSEEHKILGFRPPHGSFAAEVQSVAAKHPEGKPEVPVDTGKLKEIAREDALRILCVERFTIVVAFVILISIPVRSGRQALARTRTPFQVVRNPSMG